MPRFLQPHYLSAFVLNEGVRLCAWLVLLALIFVPLERIWGLHPRRLFRKAFGTDLIYYFLSGFLPRLLLILPLTLLAAVLHRLIPADFYQSMGNVPLWLRLAAALLVGEIGAYWGHRWSHEVPFLWRFHAIHHSAEEIDWLSNTRAHPVDAAFVRLCGLVPMYVLGLAQPMGNRLDVAPLFITFVGTAWGFFIHANVTWRLGWLEWLIASPAFHHWHHTNDGPDCVNKNYAAMLPWLDILFGTCHLPRRAWPGRYGIGKEMPASVLDQLVQPLLPPVDESPEAAPR